MTTAIGISVKIALLVNLAGVSPVWSQPVTSDLLSGVPFEKSVVLLKDGRAKDAYKTLVQEKERYEGTKWEPLFNFLSGTLAGRLELYTECVNHFSGGMQSKLLTDYSDLYLARCYAGIKEHEKAVETLRKFMESHPFSTQSGSALYDLAHYLVASGRVEEGLKSLNLFMKQYPGNRKIPDAYMLKGQVLERLKKPVEAYEPYRTLYYHFPENPLAEMARKRTVAIRRDRTLKIAVTALYPRKIRVERLLRKRLYREAIKDIRRLMKLVKGTKESGDLHISLARALRRSGHKTRAAGALIEFLKNYPESRTSAKARYILGKIYWNSGKPAKALRQMRKIVKRFPKSGWATRALYVAGRIYEERGKKKEAIDKYSRIIQAYSESSVRSNAVWRTGWIYFNSNEYKKVISLFEYEVITYPDFAKKEQLIYWAARAYEKKGNLKSAQSLYEKIAGFPFSYYGAIAHSRLQILKGSGTEKKVNAREAEKKALSEEQELIEKVNASLQSAGESNRKHIIKGLEFVRLGLLKNANFEFAAAEQGFKGSLEKNMVLGDLYEMADNFNRAYQIRDQVLSVLSKLSVEKLPRDYWSSFFPLSYRDYVLEFARKERVDPLLVLSVIKQESVFDPAAHSSANARGLMQIIPRTGKRLYRRVFKKGVFDKEILFDPKVNLRLGTNYLSGLLVRHKGDIVLAVATYNAGPRPVKKWSARYGGVSRDEFIEKIPYPETRRYVKKVLKNYENYKTLYPGYSLTYK